MRACPILGIIYLAILFKMEVKQEAIRYAEFYLLRHKGGWRGVKAPVYTPLYHLDARLYVVYFFLTGRFFSVVATLDGRVRTRKLEQDRNAVQVTLWGFQANNVPNVCFFCCCFFF